MGSRDRERDRDRSPVKRHNDEDLDVINNPKTANCRVFVGDITPDSNKEALEKELSQFGPVSCVIVNKKGYGFVQFGDEDSAKASIRAGWVMVDGQKHELRPVRVGGGGGGGGSDHNRDHMMREGRGGGGNSRRPDGDNYGRNDRYSPSRQQNEGRGYSRDPYRSHPDDYYPPPRDYYDRYSAGGGGGGYDNYRPREEYAPPPRVEPPSNPNPVDPLDPARPNDVEIVVPNKMQRAYAESIEAHLKRLNMLVDLLFPPPDIQPSQVLQDLSDRHCLYAIFVTADNEKHQSMTVNILHGTPQEHRNMPFDDAYRLIQQNFEDYIKKMRQRNVRQVVPRDIRNLMLDLVESKPVSMGDLDKMIKYLRERQTILVDDQIEQKREMSGGSAARAVTYPGYNIPSNGISGSSGGASMVGAAPAAVTATVPVAAQSAAASYSSPYGVQAQSGTQYPTYGVAAVGSVQSLISQATDANPSGAKQSELQDRILSIMKGQGGPMGSGSMQQPSGVPAPVPAPAVPPPAMMQTPWMPPKPSDSANKNNQTMSMSTMYGYNPWNQ